MDILTDSAFRVLSLAAILFIAFAEYFNYVFVYLPMAIESGSVLYNFAILLVLTGSVIMTASSFVNLWLCTHKFKGNTDASKDEEMQSSLIAYTANIRRHIISPAILLIGFNCITAFGFFVICFAFMYSLVVNGLKGLTGVEGLNAYLRMKNPVRIDWQRISHAIVDIMWTTNKAVPSFVNKATLSA